MTGLLVILIDFMIFWLPFLGVITMSMLTGSFFAQLDPGVFLPAECFHLAYDLNGCKSKVNIHLLSSVSY